jgi:predicted RNA-binding Zn-ribbon protein involved in translation (DUF1610 family)
MFKGVRARERVFEALMWLVSIVLAGFLIGLGSLVIGDLPKASRPVAISDFVDPAQSARLTTVRAELERLESAARASANDADVAAGRADEAYTSARETFDNWVRTRSATSDPAQDPEVLTRTRALDALKAAQDARNAEAAAAQSELNEIKVRLAENDAARERLNSAAMPHYERAKFIGEMQVFGLRLALTLPLLAIAAWMLLRRRGSDYWPMMRGFILFALFAFFVELVPYLPEYGGYVRYSVGIALTVILGHFGMKRMRAYLKAREFDESRSEPERVKSVAYDEALKKLAAKSCPGCDRILPATDAPIDYCVHCGMHLFNRCHTCETRKFAFFRYCMTCGAPATPESAATPPA